MFDFPDAFAPKRPIDLRSFKPFHSITLSDSFLDRAVLVFPALKSIQIRSLMEKKFSNSILTSTKASFFVEFLQKYNIKPKKARDRGKIRQNEAGIGQILIFFAIQCTFPLFLKCLNTAFS
jgi:hypothetical protein